MTIRTFFKASIATTLAALLLTACNDTPENTVAPTQTSATSLEYPSFRKALDCLPEGAALMASHRGTSKSWSLPENSLSGLNKLIQDGYKVAEIDIASTRDGVLFTYHDGVWEEGSTGKGAIAATHSAELEKILLKTRGGRITSERPPRLSDMLALAKDRIYLEIDFKSSAKYEPVLKAIRQADMADQVVLIAYSDGQAKKLSRLAPDMLLSVPPSSARPENLVWFGADAVGDPQVKTVRNMGADIIGRVWKRRDARQFGTMLKNANLLVTDYIEQYDPIMGLKDKGAYEACLTTE